MDAAIDVEAVLSADSTDTVSRIRTGLAFAAAHLWDNAPRRSAATDILVRLIPQADQRTSYGIMHVFQRSDVLTADADTEQLLRELHRYPTVLNGEYGSFFADRLQDLLSTSPDLVLDLCMDVVALWQPECGPKSGFADMTAQLTNVFATKTPAVTLDLIRSRIWPPNLWASLSTTWPIWPLDFTRHDLPTQEYRRNKEWTPGIDGTAENRNNA